MEDDNKVLIGYVQDFRDPQTIDYAELTHIIFSFAHPTKDGHLLLNGESALNNFRTTVSNAEIRIKNYFSCRWMVSYQWWRIL